MFLRLTDENNNLVVINVNNVYGIYLATTKKGCETRVCMTNQAYFCVKETVSEISLLLQSAGKVLKYGESEE